MNRSILGVGCIWYLLISLMIMYVPSLFAEQTDGANDAVNEAIIFVAEGEGVQRAVQPNMQPRSTYSFMTVQGRCMKIGVKSTGSFGNYYNRPGLQYNKACNGTFTNNHEFVVVELPWEALALNINGTVYQDTNYISGSYGGYVTGGNNLVDTSSITNQSGKLYRGTRWNHRLVTKGTKRGLYDIENDIRFNSNDKIIEIATYLKPKRKFGTVYIGRSVDADAQIVSGDSLDAYHGLGYSTIGKKWLVLGETVRSRAVVGYYTGEELNTGAGMKRQWPINWDDPAFYYTRQEYGYGDYLMGISKKFTNLIAGREYVFRYTYVFGESAFQVAKSVVQKGAGGGKPGKVPGCKSKCTIVNTGNVEPPTRTVTRTPSPTTTPPYDSGDLELCSSNCNFSSGSMTGWSQSGGSFDVNSDFVRSSPYAVNGTSSTAAEFYRSFSVSAYATYIDQSGGQVNVNAYIDPGNAENGALNIYFLNASGVALAGGWESGWKTNSREEWTQVSKSLNVPVGTRSIMIKFKARRSSGSYTDMNVDDVSVIARFRSTRIVPLVTVTPTVKP